MVHLGFGEANKLPRKSDVRKAMASHQIVNRSQTYAQSRCELVFREVFQRFLRRRGDLGRFFFNHRQSKR